MTENRQKPIQWLCILLYIHLASLLLSAWIRLSPVLNLTLGGNWITWIQRGLNIASVICLFLLPMRYRKAAAFKAAWLICSLVNILAQSALPQMGIDLYLMVNTVLSLAGSVFSMIALYLEYKAHSTLAAPKDANKWGILFFCGLAVSLAVSAAVSIAQSWVEDMALSGNLMAISLFNLGMWLPNLAVSIAYLVLLFRTIQHVKNEETTYG